MNSEPRPPISDSPWFWLLTILAAAVIGAVAIAPKYARRQEAIERKFEARQEIARRQAAGEGLSREGESARNELSQSPRSLHVPIWTLITALAVLLVVLGIFVWRQQRLR